MPEDPGTGEGAAWSQELGAGGNSVSANQAEGPHPDSQDSPPPAAVDSGEAKHTVEMARADAPAPLGPRKRRKRKPLSRFEIWTVVLGLIGIVVAGATGGAIIWQDMIAARTLKELEKQYPKLVQSADAATDQATLARQELEGTMAAVLKVTGGVYETAEGSFYRLPHVEITLINNGHLTASRINVDAEIKNVTLPRMQQIGKGTRWVFAVKPVVPQPGLASQYEHPLEISPKFLDLMYDTQRSIVVDISTTYFDGFEEREDHSCWAFLGGRTPIKKQLMQHTTVACEDMALQLRMLKEDKERAFANK